MEDVKRELAQAKYEGEAYKKAYHTVENENRNLVEMFEQALNEEIRKFRERSARGREEGFEQEKQGLNGGTLQLGVRRLPL